MSMFTVPPAAAKALQNAATSSLEARLNALQKSAVGQVKTEFQKRMANLQKGIGKEQAGQQGGRRKTKGKGKNKSKKNTKSKRHTRR